MKPYILVLTPTLGNRKSLIKTVSSVKSVGGEKVKHVIVAPHKEVNKLQIQFSELEILAEPENSKGIYSALNYGFSKYGRDYKYLTFINDDDYWLPDFKKLIAVVDHDKSIDFVYGKIQFINEEDEIIKKQACSGQFKSFLSLLNSNIVLFTQQATLLRSELFFEMGGFSEDFRLISDSKLWIDLSLRTIKYEYINRVCAAYMLQDVQLSSNKTLQSAEHIKLLNCYPKTSLLKIYFDRALFRIINFPIYLNRFRK